MKNIIEAVVQPDLCCGCGLCATVCPHKALDMVWDMTKGELVPRESGECPRNCQLCLEVCPFSDAGQSLEELTRERFSGLAGINQDPDVGYYLDCFCGHSIISMQREKGASGGMVTWLLENLLEESMVDGVIAVKTGSLKDDDRLFQYALLKDVPAIRAAASSKYYPVEISCVLAEIMKEKADRAYAIVALPCRVFGLLRAMARIPRLRKKIRYVIGLTCGMLPNRFFTEYCASRSGISVKDLAHVDYRHVGDSQKAYQFSLVATSRGGRRGKPVPYHLQYALWVNHFFMHRACRFCDDVFAEGADAVFMDAWLPEYTKDPGGNSLLLLRNPELNALLIARGCGSNTAQLQPITVQRVVESQGGAINKKRVMIAGRLWQETKIGNKVPRVRIPASKEIYQENRKYLEAQYLIFRKSKKIWKDRRENNDTGGFEEALSEILKGFGHMAQRDSFKKALQKYSLRRFLGRFLSSF